MSMPNQNPYAAPPVTGFQPPPGMGGGSVLATRMERFAGAFVDGLILGGAGFVVGIGLGFGLVAAGVEPGSVAFTAIVAVLSVVINAAIFLALNGFLLATRGQTIGKVLLKTRIVADADESLVPLVSLVLKRYLPIWVASAIPMVGPLVGLVNALLIFRGSVKCLHDDIAGTKVIKAA
ncbi:MAG TPA: RDD family protein [Pirellulaceae bacterium]|nr:RDD family protein [Pirellulaceae bacterium]